MRQRPESCLGCRKIRLCRCASCAARSRGVNRIARNGSWPRAKSWRVRRCICSDPRCGGLRDASCPSSFIPVAALCGGLGHWPADTHQRAGRSRDENRVCCLCRGGCCLPQTGSGRQVSRNAVGCCRLRLGLHLRPGRGTRRFADQRTQIGVHQPQSFATYSKIRRYYWRETVSPGGRRSKTLFAVVQRNSSPHENRGEPIQGNRAILHVHGRRPGTSCS